MLLSGNITGNLDNTTLADNTVGTTKITNNAVTGAKIAPGSNGQILTTVAGATAWTTPAVIDISAARNGLSVTANNVELGGALTKATAITSTTNQHLTFTGAGNLGIGTNGMVPTAKLHVNGTTRIENLPSTNNQNYSDMVVDNNGNIYRKQTETGVGNSFITNNQNITITEYTLLV